MALITCPDCGKEVSDRAKSCIHCGCPLEKPDYTVKIKTPRDRGTIVKVTYTFLDGKTGKVLATAHQNEVVSLEITEPMQLVCHLGRGFRDAILNYIPHPGARYKIVTINEFFYSEMRFQEVDVIDSD